MYMYLRHNNKGIVTSWLHGLNGENNNCDNTYGTALHVYVSVTYVLCPGNCDNTYGTALHVYVSVTYVLCPGISLTVTILMALRCMCMCQSHTCCVLVFL